MTQTITEETKRRLALGLVIRPPHRNRRRTLVERILAFLEKHFNLI